MSGRIRNVTVVGIGVLGSQIAFQIAFRGIPVVAYDVDDKALAQARDRIERLAEVYEREMGGAGDALDRVRLTTDLADATSEANLIIEAVPEVLSIKRDTYARLAAVAPENAIFATNSSTLLPSDLVAYTSRPDKFLALHFANDIWKFNTAEIMGTTATSPTVFRTVANFAADIGMVPIELHKEKAGYVLNSLLVPFLNAATALAAGGYADPESVDTTWRIATGAPLGPFQILDVVGLNTPYNILMQGDEEERQLAAWLKENYIDKGKLGRATGEGFYTY